MLYGSTVHAEPVCIHDLKAPWLIVRQACVLLMYNIYVFKLPILSLSCCACPVGSPRVWFKLPWLSLLLVQAVLVSCLSILAAGVSPLLSSSQRPYSASTIEMISECRAAPSCSQVVSLPPAKKFVSGKGARNEAEFAPGINGHTEQLFLYMVEMSCVHEI